MIKNNDDHGDDDEDDEKIKRFFRQQHCIYLPEITPGIGGYLTLQLIRC